LLQSAEDESRERGLDGLARVLAFYRQRLAALAIHLSGGAS
jgi:hypothetical protein